jgi:hypothetical protein
MANFEEREDSETTVVPLRPKTAHPVFNAISTLGHAAIARRRSGETDTGKPPAWVVGYLLLCIALTVIGLIVLFFEHRMLSGASP